MGNFNDVEKVTVNSREVEIDIAKKQAQEESEKKKRYEEWESTTHSTLTEYLKDKEKKQNSIIISLSYRIRTR